MISLLVAIALNRDLQGDPAYIRCARCGTVSDKPYRISSRTTYQRGRPLEHTTTPPEWTCPSCGRERPFEVGEQLPNDTVTLVCRYTWKVPRSLATVTCPCCNTSQPISL